MAIKHLNLLFVLICCAAFGRNAVAQTIKNDPKTKTVTFGNEKMSATLEYDKKANLCSLIINGQQVIQSNAGIYSTVRTKTSTYSTLQLAADPIVTTSANTVSVKVIQYGDKSVKITENWTFTVNKSDIKLDMDRTFSKGVLAEKVGFPVLEFDNMHVWEGAYQDYGGLAWFYLFNKKLDTYGVHSHSARFWNSQTGNGLTLEIAAPGNQVAMDFSRTASDKLACTVAVSSADLQPRFDTITHRRRYVRDTTDVWSPINIAAGKTSQHITFSAFDFEEKFGRGHLVGINQAQVSAVLNTIARIGVIDKQHFGGNSWHTPYGPICLHEQYIAQMGLAINDDAYLSGYQECLDFYRDNAIKPDGRVWPRWAYSNEDAMPQIFTDKGFYEAQWGYLLDANPDFVTNVAELYDQTGDLKWVKTQQQACEKALDWLMNRDSNNNALVEMMTDSHKQKRGSDWIDIIWAAYENAFVNAKLYHALVLWADVEKQLGSKAKAQFYADFAKKLKANFNKPTTQGGFWDAEKKCYVHWRDKDGTVHGVNMVTPVNFMAIAYGICDDTTRIKTILDDIETQMQKENLFFWPICMFTYAEGEGNDWQFPFANYENGDLFLSWGAVGVKAYAEYKPELALKYVKNVLAQYAKDGLAFQRYGRAKQDGLGDDILSGNSLSVVGLYQAIYGINPLYNRFYLNPHIAKELAGTEVNYNFRNQNLKISLDLGQFAVSNGQFKVISNTDFGFFGAENELLFFNRNAETASLKATVAPNSRLTLDVKKWAPDEMRFTQESDTKGASKLVYQINGLKANGFYSVLTNNKALKRIKSDPNGTLTFECATKGKAVEIVVLSK